MREDLTAKELGKQVYVESSRAVAEGGPKVALTICVAVLVWMFGNLVFIPLSEGLMLSQYAVTQIISLIILSTLAMLVLSTVIQARRLTNAAAGFLAYSIGARRGEVTQEELDHYKTALTGIAMVLIIALAFLLFSENLATIHPALAGIALIVAVIWSMVTLWRSGRALAAEIKTAADELAKRITERTPN